VGKEHLFPCPVELLDKDARKIWDSWQDDLRAPGEMLAHRYHTTPARIHQWPDASGTDQDNARRLSPEWGRIVPHDSLFLVIMSARPDCLGNPWYLVSVATQVGYLRAADTSDPQEYIDTQRKHVADHGREVTGHELGRLPHA